MLDNFKTLLLIKNQYYSHHLWKFQNNSLGIMQNTAYLIWKGQNRKSQNMEFWLKSVFQWGYSDFICHAEQ